MAIKPTDTTEGIELPTEPGVWEREGATWLIGYVQRIGRESEGVLEGCYLGGEGNLGYGFEDFPRGGWFPATPAPASPAASARTFEDWRNDEADDATAAPAEQVDSEPRLVQLARVIQGWYREGSDAHQAASEIIADYEADDAMLRRENEQLREQLAAAQKRISLAGGYHERTAREVAIDEWLRHKPSHIPGPTQSDIRYLLELVDAGRNRVHDEIGKRESAESRIAELTRELADWWRSREALSSDCPSLGISGDRKDSAKWGDELARRCEPLRAFCNRYFNGKIPAEKGAQA